MKGLLDKAQGILAYIGLLALLFVILATFSDRNVQIDMGGSAYIISTSWWGLKKKITSLRIIRGEWHYLNKKNNNWEEIIWDFGV